MHCHADHMARAEWRKGDADTDTPDKVLKLWRRGRPTDEGPRDGMELHAGRVAEQVWHGGPRRTDFQGPDLARRTVKRCCRVTLVIKMLSSIEYGSLLSSPGSSFV
jgi:hypothetical protein